MIFGKDRAPRYTIRDRDCIYGYAVLSRLRAMGIGGSKTLARKRGVGPPRAHSRKISFRAEFFGEKYSFRRGAPESTDFARPEGEFFGTGAAACRPGLNRWARTGD
jgi:hypothetical protein